MNKLFEKNPLIHYTFVLTIVAIACGLVIGGIHAWTNPIIEQNEYDRKVESYQSVLPDMDKFTELSLDDDPESIQEKVEAINASGDVIGYIININQTNGYGNMQIVMAIDAEGMILSAEFLQLNQTLNLDNTRANLQMYVGQNINDQHDYDFLSGATRSLETLDVMIEDIKTAYSHIDIEIPVDIGEVRLQRYQELLDTTASFTELDLSTDPESIVVKAALYDENETLVGYAIEASLNNDFGSLHVVLVTDTDGTIVGASYVDYNNSYYESVMTSAMSDLVGLTMTDDLKGGFALAAPSSGSTVPTMNALMTDIVAAYGHIDMEGADA